MFEKIKIYNPHLDRDAFRKICRYVVILYNLFSEVAEQAAQRCYFKRVQSNFAKFTKTNMQ